MSYSLAASIGAGCGLGVVGMLLVGRARTHDPGMFVYAFFLVVFSIHPLIEGVNWYALAWPFAGDDLFLYLYSIIAIGFWPICIQLAAAVAEERSLSRKVRWAMAVCGAALSIYLWSKRARAEDSRSASTIIRWPTSRSSTIPRYRLVIYVALTVLPSVLFPNRAVNAFGWLGLGSHSCSRS